MQRSMHRRAGVIEHVSRSIARNVGKDTIAHRNILLRPWQEEFPVPTAF